MTGTVTKALTKCRIVVTVRKTLEIPAIPDGFKFDCVNVENRYSNSFGKSFSKDTVAKCVEQASEYITDHYGWDSGLLSVCFNNDTHYGWHKLDDGFWTTELHPWEE